MLIVTVRLEFEWQRPSIHLYADHLCAQAECRRELDPAITCPSSSCLEFHAVSCLAILKVHTDSSDADIANRKRHPIGRNVRSKIDLMFFCVRLQPEQTAQDWTDDHGCGPDLVRRTGRERLVVVAGENFSEMAERPVRAEQRIRPQIRVRRKGAMVAVFGHRSPSSE